MDANKRNRTIFSRRLTQLRRSNGMTQKQIAQSLSIDRSTYAYYELDKTKPDFETLVRISNIYQVSLDYLLGQSDSPSSPSVVVREPGPTYGDALSESVPLSGLSEDEQSFIIMYRQMDDQQRRSMLEYALSCLRNRFGEEKDAESNNGGDNTAGG